MPRARTAARKDANHNELAKAWVSLGGSWQDTYQLSCGALDGIAGMFGIDVRVEIKSGNSPLTVDEGKTFNEWKGRAPVIWRTVEDVIATAKRLAGED